MRAPLLLCVSKPCISVTRKVTALPGCFRLQALVNSMWALAKMGFTLNEQGVLALMTLLRERLPVFLPPSSPSSAQPPLHPLHTTPIPASAAHCPPQASHPSGPSAAQTAAASARQPTRSLSLNAQELSNLLYALARFGHAPGPDMQHDLLAACSQYMHTRSYSQPPPTHHSSSTGTVSLGTSSASGAATAALSRPFNAQELSNVLWSLSQLGVQPSDAWLGDFWMAVLHQIRWGWRKEGFKAQANQQGLFICSVLLECTQSSSVLLMFRDFRKRVSIHVWCVSYTVYAQHMHTVVPHFHPVPCHFQPASDTSTCCYGTVKSQIHTQIKWKSLHMAPVHSFPPPLNTLGLNACAGHRDSLLCTAPCRAFNAKDLSQVVYALAKLGRQPPSASISHVQSSPMGSHGRPSMRGPEPPAAHEPHMQAQSPPNAAMPPAQHASLSPLHVDSSSTPSPSSVPAWARALLQEAAATFSRCGGQDLANLGCVLLKGLQNSVQTCRVGPNNQLKKGLKVG